MKLHMMKTKLSLIKSYITIFVGLILLCFLPACGEKKLVDKFGLENKPFDEIYVGDIPISDYSIFCEGRRTYPIAKKMQEYVYRLTGDVLPICFSSKEGYYIKIRIYENRQNEGADYHINGGNIEIEGNANIFVEPKMYELLNTYFGYMFAGSNKECTLSDRDVIYIPSDLDEIADVWIKQREATVTLWKPNFARGNVYNAATSNLTDVLSYSDEQLYQYVKMLKACGFNGVQVTDICSSWSGISGYKFAQERLRFIADAAHSLGMKFTLWVWASEFSDFSWVDEEACYDKGEYAFAHENPAVMATFEKYYDIYTELADCCDRVICHFYDPGELTEAEDVGFFAKLLCDKMKAVNPSIDFGVSCWVDAFDRNTLINYLGNDVTLYETTYPVQDEKSANTCNSFRTNARDFGCRLGTWAWNTCEMETDQLAQMNYNAEYIKYLYQIMRNYDEVYPTTYWSEMDAYHVLNVFSLYCAGHLLANPDLDTDELTFEVAEAFVGEKNAEDFERALRLIEMARTGKTYDSFFWNNDEYILKNTTYPTEDIVRECEYVIPALKRMIESGVESRYLPLPISANQLLRLILPHIEQIKQYAEFRISFDALKKDFETGIVDSSSAEKELFDISSPIPEFNSTIGLWGQIEARAQRELIVDFCEEYGLEIPIYPAFDELRKYRIKSSFTAYQLGKDYPVLQDTYQYGLAYGKETDRLLSEMVEEGILYKNENGLYFLTDWESYRYNFSY